MLLMLSGAALGWSQAVQPVAAANAARQTDPLSDSMVWVLGIACAAIFFVGILFLIQVNQFLTKRLIRLEAAKDGVILPEEVAPAAAAGGAPPPPVTVPVDDFWARLRKKYWEDAVPVEREGEILMHHSYDGIRELDNSLPPWWVNMFVLTVFWAFGYMYFYHWGGDGPSSTEEYKINVEQAKAAQAMTTAGKAESVDEAGVTALTDAGALSDGELIYKNLCASCHGPKGEGLVGPNLTDEYWLHGGGIKNIFKTIKYGVVDKGMISWQTQLKPVDMQKVASYILTLKGANPPNPKAPQGEIWVEETTTPDTTATQPEGQKTPSN